MMFRHLISAVLSAAAIVSSCTSAAAESMRNLLSVPGSGVSVSVQSLYEHVPLRGYFPMTVEIENDSGSSRTWTLTSSASTLTDGGESTFGYEESLSVPDHTTRTFSILVPLPTAVGSSSWKRTSLRVELRGFGVRDDALTFTGQYNYNRYGDQEPSSRLLLGGARAVDDRLLRFKSHDKFPLMLNRLTAASFPRDWRALIGIDVVLLDALDLDELPSESMRALERYLTMGGELALFGTDAVTLARQLRDGPLVRALQQPRAVLGKLWMNPSDLKSIISSESQVSQERGWLQTLFRHDAAGLQFRSNRLEASRISGLLMLLVLLIYAALVGPLNLIYFAPAGSRLRVFITTPLIAMGAMACVLGSILLKDGVGGHGVRTSLVFLDGSRQEAAVVESQAARTGMMLRTFFGLPDGTFFRPYPSKGDGRTGFFATPRLFEEGGTVSGNWFPSSSRQDLVALAFQPSRARLYLKSAGDPAASVTVHSDLPVAVDRLMVFRGGGELLESVRERYCYRSDAPLQPGATAVLTASSCGSELWWKTTLTDSQTSVPFDVKYSEGEHYSFIASSGGTSPYAIATSQEISWEDALILIGETVMERSSS